jgi:ribosomal protein S18 acetylase RimI-like enzyme
MHRTDFGTIRPYREADHTAVVDLAGRLAVGIAPWRSHEGMAAAARGWAEASIAAIGPERAVFVAEGHDGTILGFGSVARQVEFTGEPQAYIGELAVAEAVEGAGIGTALLAAIERWACAQGLRLIVLDTGAGNTRARRFYGRNGFGEEGVRLTKLIDVAPS